MRLKRNIELHTSADDAKRNILTFLLKHHPDASSHGANKSTLGRVAFPAYEFKAQGAAFAVAKIAKALVDDGLITTQHHYASGKYWGYGIHLTRKGGEAAEKLRGTRTRDDLICF